MEENEFKTRFQALLDAIKTGDSSEIERKKVNLLFTARCYYEVIFNYLFLEKIGFHFDFGFDTIKKGTLLYRVRKLDKPFNINDKKEWGPSPFKRENRANKNNETAMYFNVMPDICELETHLNKNVKYAIAKYEVKEDIVVGGYFNFKGDKRLFIAGVLFNSFLIAPSRGENNLEMFKVLDNHYGKLNIDDVTDDDVKNNNFDLPLKLAVLVTKDDTYYHLTNEICDVLKRYYPDGIRYSSCYAPIETIGISSNCYNLVLYEEGIKKISFVDAKELVYNQKMTSTDLIKIMFETIDKAKQNKIINERC